MGFDLSNVLSDERHYSSFVCAICQSLVELDALATSCSHCFCKQCLPLWLEKSSKCPSCNQDLQYTSSSQSPWSSMMIGNHTLLVQPLAKSQPLAYRLLSSILVQCPLRLTGVPCSWRGDYGDLQSHLLSSTAHTDNSTEPQQHRTEQLALSLKEEANQKFESRHFSEAKSLYTKAIEVLQQEQLHEVESALLSTLYSNRAATHLQLQDYNQCLEDCQYIIQNIPNTDSNNNIKVYIRAIRASIQLGDLNQASNYVTLGLEEHPQHSSLVKNQGIITQLVQMYAQGNHQLQSQQYATAKATFGKLLAESPSAISFLLGAAQADLGLGLTESAIRLTKRVLMKHAQNPRGCWIRGQAVFLMGDAKVGIQLLQEALRLDPDCEEIKLSFKLAKKVDRWLMVSYDVVLFTWNYHSTRKIMFPH